MSSMFDAGFGFLFALPVLIAQWVGVVALAKGGRNPAWWCMAAGTALTTIGSVLSLLIMVMMITNLSEVGGMTSIISIYQIVAGFSGLGSLVFVIGFAMHGIRSKKILDRVEELESLIAAQGEQLNRQNPGEPS
ncbi:hypothetical protein ACFQY0_08810 [Haloferula chungangensis]|uniref:Uncharacterized protein n=1 Tax=Haloferula chungangensis TaxID=1048331 RepID=A0ABW2L7K4_9BACT